MAVKCFCDHCGKEIVVEYSALDDKVFAVKEASLEFSLYLEPKNGSGCDVQLCGECFNDFYSYINKYFNIPDNAPDESFWNVVSKAIIEKEK